MKKFLVVVASVLLLVGCGNKELKKYYDNMEVNPNMIGYTIDLRFDGIYNDKKVNDIVRVDNYMNKDYIINDSNRVIDKEDSLREADLYISNGKSYVMKEEKYISVEETSMYTNTNIYLTGLLKAKKVGKPTEDEIGTKKYTSYTFKVDKKTMNEILKNTSLKLEVTKDVEAKVYIEEDKVYKIVYNIHTGLEQEDTLVLSVCYFKFNGTRELNIDSTIYDNPEIPSES